MQFCTQQFPWNSKLLYISSNSPAGCSAELASGPGRWSREGMIQVGRLSHPDPPAGGICYHNPVLQWSWPSPSLWLVQGGRRQYAGGVIIQETDFSLCKVVLVIIASYVYACSWHDFRITAVLMPARIKICLELHVAVSVWKYYMDSSEQSWNSPNSDSRSYHIPY